MSQKIRMRIGNGLEGSKIALGKVVRYLLVRGLVGR